MPKDYYNILDLERDSASPAEIKQAYRKLAMQYHPDTNEEEDAHQRFVDINEAYQVLSDEKLRAEYHYVCDHPELEDTFVPPEPVYYKSYRSARQRRDERRTRRRATAGDNMYRGHSFQRAYASGRSFRRPAATRPNLIGFYYFSLFAICMALLSGLLSGSLFLDYLISFQTEPERVKHVYEKPYTLLEPGILRVSTENHSFHLSRSYEKWLTPGTVIRLQVTPIWDYPTHVYVELYRGRKRKIYKLKTMGGMYGFNYLLILASLLGSILTFFAFFKGGPEFCTYTGTVNILFFIMLLAAIHNT